MLVIRARTHKMLVRVANREDPDQSELRAISESKAFDTLTVLPKDFFKS